MFKKVFVSIIAFSFFQGSFAQAVSRITIGGNGQVDYFDIGLPESVQVYVSKEGLISKWGFDRFIGYQENYNGDLQPYVGRVEYYTQQDDAALRGKVKYIGRTLLTYYASYENEALQGKLKSIGAVNFDYYLSFADAALRGNIKTLGRQSVNWYTSFENEGIRGKLKSVGPTQISYYSSFEDRAFRGKVKSIDRFTITYYSSFEQFSGSMKTGSTLVNANGIKYYIRNF